MSVETENQTVARRFGRWRSSLQIRNYRRDIDDARGAQSAEISQPGPGMFQDAQNTRIRNATFNMIFPPGSKDGGRTAAGGNNPEFSSTSSSPSSGSMSSQSSSPIQTPATSVILDSIPSISGNPHATPSEIYRDHLQRKNLGHPLWVPGPDENLPAVYLESGIMVGDVGIINTHGDFSYLFSVVHEATHPRNAEMELPPDFVPFTASPATCGIQRFREYDGVTGCYLADDSVMRWRSLEYGNVPSFSCDHDQEYINESRAQPHYQSGGKYEPLDSSGPPENTNSNYSGSRRRSCELAQFDGADGCSTQTSRPLPSDILVDVLLRAIPSATSVSVCTQDWGPYFTDSVENNSEFIEKVLSNNDICEEDGMVYFEQIKHRLTTSEPPSEALHEAEHRPALTEEYSRPRFEPKQALWCTRISPDVVLDFDSSYGSSTMLQSKETFFLSPDEEQNMQSTTDPYSYNPKDSYDGIMMTISPNLGTSFSISDKSTQKIPTLDKGRCENGHDPSHTTYHKKDTRGHHIHERHLCTNTDAWTLQPPPTIPRAHSRRTLVMCFDGTGNEFGEENSNVVRFFDMLKKDSSARKMVCYQPGIGTYAKPMVANPHKIMDSMAGVNLHEHIISRYEFLMQNYEPRDKISLFGFSRGAYTAQVLADTNHKVGLLPKEHHEELSFAWKLCARDDDEGWRKSSPFKKAFPIDVNIGLLGVWETVSSAGMISKRPPLTTLTTHAMDIRHALALDEIRVRFRQSLYNQPVQAEMQRELDEARLERKMLRQEPHQRNSMRELARQYYDHFHHHEVDVEEVWFAGCHSDVGGGAAENGNNLARIPLRWMESERSILFHQITLADMGMDYNTLWPQFKSCPPPVTSFSNGHLLSLTRPLFAMSVNHTPGVDNDFLDEEDEDYWDAFSPINDRMRKLSINRGEGRFMPEKLYEDVKLPVLENHDLINRV